MISKVAAEALCTELRAKGCDVAVRFSQIGAFGWEVYGGGEAAHTPEIARAFWVLNRWPKIPQVQK